jgi:hypothetical protein
MLSGLILGLNQPENDTYLRPLIEDLNIIWYKGVGVFKYPIVGVFVAN